MTVFYILVLIATSMSEYSIEASMLATEDVLFWYVSEGKTFQINQYFMDATWCFKAVEEFTKKITFLKLKECRYVEFNSLASCNRNTVKLDCNDHGVTKSRL